MNLYNEMSRRLEKASAEGRLQEEIDRITKTGSPDERRTLELLLHPEKQQPIVRIADCRCGRDNAECEIDCLFGAVERDSNGRISITGDCTGCGICEAGCDAKALTGTKEIIPLLEVLAAKKEPVYAMIAPAFSGQFTPEVTSGRLRSAFKRMGFYGMLEVALFADILTLKETLEFDRAIHNADDFLLTSCCCPIWVAMIRKSYSTLIPHIPPSVSPMVACGRSIKKIHPEAKTVFIGPCVAKKAEAKEKDIADAVDFVLTFEEVAGLFQAFQINPAELPEDLSDHSSGCGRMYARTSGVSEAVQNTLNRLRPGRKIPIVTQQADGTIACKALLKEIASGKVNANFIEGMGCKGGCVGGPKSLIGVGDATEHVNKYASAAKSETPADNPHVFEILRRLGFDTIDSLLEENTIFTRKFD